MLCDELIAGGAPLSGCNIACLIPALRNAQKFVLGSEFAAVAESLSLDYSGLTRVFDRCRLPFAQTWIEVTANDRPGFMASGIQAPGYQVAPKRVGFLLTAARTDLSAWTAHLFWSNPTGCSAAAIAMGFDMTDTFGHASLPPSSETNDETTARIRTAIVPNVAAHPGWKSASESVRQMMVDHTNPCPPAYGWPLPLGLPVKKYDEFYSIVAQLARSDWAGEAAYLLATIGLLNARNAVELETVDYSKLNRSRVKAGKPPLMTHKVLKIARRQQQRVYGDGEGRGDHAPMRGHFVRGHFKARRSGIFFWNPHARGDFHRGRIEKDYELT